MSGKDTRRALLKIQQLVQCANRVNIKIKPVIKMSVNYARLVIRALLIHPVATVVGVPSVLGTVYLALVSAGAT